MLITRISEPIIGLDGLDDGTDNPVQLMDGR